MYVDGEVLPHYCETKRICANGCGAILSGYNQNPSGFCSLCESKRITAELETSDIDYVLSEERANLQHQRELRKQLLGPGQVQLCGSEECTNIAPEHRDYCSDKCQRRAAYLRSTEGRKRRPRYKKEEAVCE